MQSLNYSNNNNNSSCKRDNNNDNNRDNDNNNNNNIGIKHVFPYINVWQVPRELLKTEAEGRSFRQLARDLANVNALENNV